MNQTKLDTSTKIARNTFLNFISTSTRLGFAFLISIFVARLLGPTNFGIYGLLMFAITCLILLGGLGFDNSITKYVSEFTGKNDKKTIENLLGFAFRIRILSVTVVALILLAIAFYAGYVYSNELYKIYILIIAVNSIPLGISGIFNAGITGFQKYKYLTISVAIISPINLVLTLLVLFLGYGIIGLLAVGVVNSAISAMISCILLRKLTNIRIHKPHLDPETKKRFIKYSLHIVAISFLDMIVWQKSEVFFLGIFRSASEVGFYVLAYGLSTYIVATIPGMFSSVLMPAMSELYGADKKESLSRLFVDSTRYLMMIAIPLCVIGIVLAEPIIEIIYGSAYLPAVNALRILLVSTTIAAVSSGASAAIYGIERADLIFKFGLVLAITNVVLNITLIPKFGLIGAAIGNTSTILFAMILSVYVVMRTLHILYPILDLIKILFSSTILGGCVYLLVIFLARYSPSNLFLTLLLFLVIIFGLMLYIIIILFLKFFNKEDLIILGNIEGNVPKFFKGFYSISLKTIERFGRL
jgi:O-antigen/teichoic acid export membrane protein